jgi:PncC family amidohydrolase
MTDTLHLTQRVGERLMERGLTLASAESCTGGLIGHLITEIAGSSAYYIGGIIAYSNAVKEAQLGVPQATLMTHGAVSQATAEAMATGVRGSLKADVGVATTGIAGPGGGTPAKPVGLVYVAVATADTTRCERFVFSGDRQSIKQQTAVAALHLLLDSLQ